jgi:uncharacterized protein YjbI with pentapeptide repeats
MPFAVANKANNLEVEKYRWLNDFYNKNQKKNMNSTLVFSDLKRKKITNNIQINDKSIDTNINYQGAIFNGSVGYVLVQFLKDVSFYLATFNKNADFSNSRFRKASFEWVVFIMNSNFSYTTFLNDVSFYRTVFTKNSIFYGARFEKVSNFYSILAKEEIDFSETRYYFLANYGQAIFKKLANFHKAEFNEGADFSKVKFNGRVNFSNTLFKEKVLFRGAEFNDIVDFKAAVLPKKFDFSHVNIIKHNIDLSMMKTSLNQPKCLINLVNADISKFNFRYQHFKLYFDKNTPEYQIESTYKKLLHNFKNKGYTNSYKILSIEQKEYHYIMNNQQIRNFIQKHWWNYGFNKEWIFIWLIIIIVILTIVNTLFYEKLYSKYYNIPFLDNPLRSYLITKNPYLKFLFYIPNGFLFTIYIFFGYFLSFNKNNEDIPTKNIFFIIYLFSIMVIGLIFALFILNYIIGF